MQTDEHFLTVCRYVERNPLRASLVKQAEAWPWSSLWRRRHRAAQTRELLTDWPVDRPARWTARVNAAETTEELEQLRRSVARGKPFGNPTWTQRTIARLGLESSIPPRGRPRKQSDEQAYSDLFRFLSLPQGRQMPDDSERTR